VSRADFDIAIAGAGMVGSCAAYALACQGYRIALIEPTEIDLTSVESAASDQIEDDQSQQFDLRVSAISPRSKEILEGLGIWQQLDPERLCHYEKMFVWHQNGSASVALDAVELARDDLGSIVENRMIQQGLHKACSGRVEIEWFRPDQIETLIDNHDNGVQLRLSSGSVINANLLIAADGRSSPTRELAKMGSNSGQYQQTAFVANVTTELPHQKTARQRFLKTGPLAFLPLANGQSSIVWSCDNEFAEQLAGLDNDEFCDAVGEAFEFKLGRITQCSSRLGFPLGWHSCEHWLNHRVLLIGDAAHSVHPLAGQGVNLGFSDVSLLVDLIGDAGTPILHKQLRRFERERKSQTWIASNGFSGLKWLFGIEHKTVSALRDLGMQVIGQNPILRRTLMRKAIENLT
jgi:2-octaprenylphenol hydroxylase